MQMFLVYVISLFAIVAIFIYDQVGRGHPDHHWESMAMHLSAYFMVFIFVTVCYSFILRPSNPKSRETFNRYQDLSNEDNADSLRHQEMPDCAADRSTELNEFNPEPLSKRE